MTRRDEFRQRTKDAVARRASFICSNPDCRVLTIAPAHEGDESVLYVGRVAHVAAAAGGGPRYDSDMSSEERSSAANAIFLCANCADMIDDNRGGDFSSDLLKKWKHNHEEWIRSQLNLRADAPIAVVEGEHVALGEGNVTGLDIEGAAIIKAGTRVHAEGKGEVTGTRIGPRKK